MTTRISDISMHPQLEPSPWCVGLEWVDGLTRYYPAGDSATATDFLLNGIAWYNPNIKCARIYDQAIQSIRLETLETLQAQGLKL